MIHLQLAASFCATLVVLAIAGAALSIKVEPATGGPAIPLEELDTIEGVPLTSSDPLTK